MIARRLLLLALPLLAACTVGGCSQPEDEESAWSESGVSEPGRWRLPKDVSAIGATIKMPYDGAPAWSSKSCAGGLKTGTGRLGEFLRDQFDAVQSVGGYACRANTANKSKMSVHGTGRALDVFIPKVRGQANNTQGDEVANWLVANAERIGVQLVIWDRTVWQANGKNDKAYSGPHPHDDHIHVELTEEAAALQTPWFKEGPVDVPQRDAGDNADPAEDDDIELGPGPTEDRDPPATPDAGSPVPTEPELPAPGVELGEDEPEVDEDEPEINEEEGRRPTDDEDRWEEADESADDEPGERDSLGTSSTKKTRSSSGSYEDEPLTTTSCGLARSRSVGGAAPAALAVLLAASLVRRRRRG